MLNLNSLRVCRNLSLTMVAVLLAGCPASNQAPQAPVKDAATANPKKVVIRGSNTIGEELAPHLIAEFKKENPDVEFDVDTKATGYGYAALRARKCDIAAASRFPTKEEIGESTSMQSVMGGTTIGNYAVIVVVNAKNSVANLTKAQVEGIFTGTITNWHDVGGPDAAIHLVARDPISGTYIGFKDLAMGSKSYAVDNITFGESYSAVAEKVGMDDAAIGYTGIQGNPASVKSVNIEGVEATAANVNSGKYPYARGLYFYTLKGEEKPAAKSFVDFVNGTKGQAILSQMGFVPHP